MHMGYFGDSYDLVKRAFISWLAPFGEWHVQPMFTEPVDAAAAQRFATLIGARMVSHEQLTRETDRATFFRSAMSVGNLFLDPDTGLRAKATGKKAPCYVTYAELVSLAQVRPHSLTMVYDQSIGRAKDEPRRAELRGKLSTLGSQDVLGFYYVSHAPMLVVSADEQLLKKAHAKLLQFLPENRVLSRLAA